jgi:hypothetical protein
MIACFCFGSVFCASCAQSRVSKGFRERVEERYGPRFSVKYRDVYIDMTLRNKGDRITTETAEQVYRDLASMRRHPDDFEFTYANFFDENGRFLFQWSHGGISTKRPYY